MKAASARRHLGVAMDAASEQVGDEGGTATTLGRGTATDDFHPTSTRNNKAKTAAVDAFALRDAVREAHEQRKANAERRHRETLEETRLGREQEGGFKRRPSTWRGGGWSRASARAQRSLS